MKIKIFELPSPGRGSSGKTIHFQALDTLKFLKGSKNTLPETNIWMVGRRSGFLFGASWAYFQKFWLVSGRVSRWKLRGSHNVRPNSPKKNIVPEIKKKNRVLTNWDQKKHIIYIYIYLLKKNALKIWKTNKRNFLPHIFGEFNQSVNLCARTKKNLFVPLDLC